MADIPNPYFINLELFWPNGNRVTQNEIARVDAFDVLGAAETWEAQCGHNPATGGWMSAIMQNVAAFSAREKPNLKFVVTSTQNAQLHVTQVFEAISSGATVKIVVGQSAEIVGGTPSAWTVYGTITDASGALVTQGKVVVSDSTLGQQRQLKEEFTLSASGAYTVSFALADFESNGVSHSLPNVLVQVYDPSGKPIASSGVRNALTIGAHRINLEAKGNASQTSAFRVYGSIKNTIGLPVAGLSVSAKHLQWTVNGFKETELTSGASNGIGNYELYYDWPNDGDLATACGTPTGYINLIVYASGTGTGGAIVELAKSDIVINAATDQRVDLVVDYAANVSESEYALLAAIVLPCLPDKDATAPDATDDPMVGIRVLAQRPDYLAFAATSSGVDSIQLKAFVAAWMIAEEINDKLASLSPTGEAAEIEPEVIYGLIRMGEGDTVPALLNVRPEAFFTAVVEAIHRWIIPSKWEAELTRTDGPSLLDLWRTILAAYLAYADSATGIAQWQQQLLAIAFPDGTPSSSSIANAQKRETIAKEYFDFVGTFEAFCELLGKKTLLGPEGQPTTTAYFGVRDMDALKFVFELYEAVSHYFGIVQAVFDDFDDQPSWKTIKDLAAVRLEGSGQTNGWLDYVETAYKNSKWAFPADVPGSTGNNGAEKIRVYATRLYHLFSGIGPVEAFKDGLASAGSDWRDVTTFLSNNSSFDLETTNIDTFKNEHELDLDDATVAKIKQIQRVYRLTTDFSAANALIGEGLDSAVKIARLHVDQFVVQYESVLGGLAKARKIHEIASHYASEILFALVKFHQHLNATGGATALTAAINTVAVQRAAASGGDTNTVSPTEGYDPTLGRSKRTPPYNNDKADTDRFPNWITLFGDLNKCACKSCQTVFGPGAYLVDLLEFVVDHLGAELSKRRPDLADIEITCSNTNVSVPYIDLVNEALEDAVVKAYPSLLSTTFDLYSGNSTVIAEARTLLNALVDTPNSANLETLRSKVKTQGGYLLTERARVQASATTKFTGNASTTVEAWVIEDDAYRFNLLRVAPSSSGGAERIVATPIPQTSSNNDSIEVFPEHVNAPVYERILGQSVFPFNLPLALGREQLEIFLSQKKVYQHEIIEALSTRDRLAPKPLSTDTERGDEAEKVALACLKMTQFEHDAVLGKSGTPYGRWGFATATGNSLVRPDKPNVPLDVTYSWYELLSVVPVFLHRASITFIELTELLEQQFIHASLPGNVIVHLSFDPTNEADAIECNYNKYQLVNLEGGNRANPNSNTLDRIGVFIRLWKKLGWSMREVDRCLVALYPQGIPDNLVKLAQVKRLTDEFDITPMMALSWVSPLDRRRTEHVKTTLFDDRFLHGTASQLEYQALATLALGGTDNPGIPVVPLGGAGMVDVDASTRKYVDYISYLRGGFELDIENMTLLWGRIVGEVTTLTAFQLSDMHRVVSFSKAMGISVKEYFDFCTVSGLRAFSTFSNVGGATTTPTEQTIANIFEFAAQIRRIRDSGVPSEEALYFLKDEAIATAPYLPNQGVIAALVMRLSPMIGALEAVYPEVENAPDEILRTSLGKVMPPDKVGRVVELLTLDATPVTNSPPVWSARFGVPSAGDEIEPEDEFGAQRRRYQNYLNWTFLCENLVALWPSQNDDNEYEAVAVQLTALLGLVSGTGVNERRLLDSVWAVLRPKLLESEKSAQIYLATAEAFGVDVDIAEQLLSHAGGLTSVTGSGTALTDWKRSLQGGYDLTGASAVIGANERAETYVTIERDESYRFTVELSGIVLPGATGTSRISVTLADLPPVSATASGSVSVKLARRACKAGEVLPLTIECIGGATFTAVKLRWKVGNAGWVDVPTNVLVPMSRKAFKKLYKATSMMLRLGMTKRELSFLLETALASSGSIFLDKLPLVPIVSANWSGFSELLYLLGLNRSIHLSGTTFCELLLSDIPEKMTRDEQIVAALEWSQQELDAVRGLWDVAPPPTWNNPRFWAVLKETKAIARRLGLRVGQISELLLDVNPTIETADALRNTYRALYDKSTWKEVFKPLSDRLRQRKRDALVAVLTNGKIRLNGKDYHFFDANDLFSHFLIDVEMEPDTLISRIRLALNVIQLYVARVFTGFESDEAVVKLTEAKDKWKWMKNYRVWEANRKVFLYPENWIEPELRGDKTPFFREFEAELLEKAATDDNAKVAFGNYLEKLNEVSDLEVIGAYSQDVNAAGIKYILHVIGRTRSRSRGYFYRTFQGKQFYDGAWTPWMRVDLDIKGDVAVPVVFNGRLFVVWSTIQIRQSSEPNAENVEVNETNAAKSRAKYLAEIRLMWSEYSPVTNKWQKVCVAKQAIIDEEAHSPYSIESTGHKLDEACYHLRVEETGSEMFAIAVIKTSLPSQDGQLSPKQLGLVRIWRNGHDTVESSVRKLSLTRCWPVGTVLKSNAAEETNLVIESEQRTDALKLKGTTPFLRRTSEAYSVYETNFSYTSEDNKPFFLTTNTKSYFVINRGFVVQGQFAQERTLRVKMQTFHHPLARQLQGLVQAHGPSGIMSRAVEALPGSESYYYNYSNYRSNYYYNYYGSLLLGYHIAQDKMAYYTTQRKFEIEYLPNASAVLAPYPLPTIEFAYGTSFGVYNWELFFHAPMLVADRLSQEMKFEEAMNWYHYVFDPRQDLSEYEQTKRWVGALPPGCRYWNFLPFFANPDATESMLATMGMGKSVTTYDRELLTALIDEWKRDPFNPHLIARHRIVAYQKNVVMKYLDNLIAWADHLFRQDTFESINLATQLYVLADELLGERPEAVEPLTREARYTYRELQAKGIDAFSNSIVEVEYLIASNPENIKGQNLGEPGSGNQEARGLMLQTLFFALPRNERLDYYWDTVADRLFKIRNSMNIDGVKRQLALYEPPIDPALLVRAAAAGLDLSGVLSQLNAQLPFYRFNVWQQKAIDLCNELKGFGSAILAALEKRDAEALQRIRQGQEIRMLKLARKVRERQVDEADANIEALEYSKKITQERYDYYDKIKRELAEEKAQKDRTDSAADMELTQGIAHSVAALFAPVPDGSFGVIGVFPKADADFPIGSALVGAANATAAIAGTWAGHHRAKAARAGFKASDTRRWDDWQLQKRLAKRELTQLDKQIAAAKIRRAIAQKELENHEQQMEHALEVRDFLQDKFTNTELYRWMVSSLSKTFQDVYKLAFDVARTAERCLQFELGLDGNTRYLQDSYLDGLHQHLLVGERFLYDLKRMDIAYLEKNKREFELQKSISLATINGAALETLREKGYCDFELPEVLFDLDHPGQYFRRIKAVRVTIPCVTGPHTNVSAKLSLLSSAIRKTTTIGGAGKYEYEGYDDGRFVHNLTGIQSIATSSAQNDGGLFELNFRDERYLPFEGAGVISRWRLELPTEARQFDYETISDVVLHVSYTARDAGGTLKEAANDAIRKGLQHTLTLLKEEESSLVRVISMKKEAPDTLHQLLNTHAANLQVGWAHFPYVLRSLGVNPTLASIDMRLITKPGSSFAGGRLTLDGTTTVTFSPPESGSPPAGEDLGGRVCVAQITPSPTTPIPEAVLRSWAFTKEPEALPANEVDDILLSIKYNVEAV